MTGDHPVTLGDLFVPLSPSWPDAGPTHRPATVADLKSAVVNSIDSTQYPPQFRRTLRLLETIDEVFDALAEAQPFPPAGGVS